MDVYKDNEWINANKIPLKDFIVFMKHNLELNLDELKNDLDRSSNLVKGLTIQFNKYLNHIKERLEDNGHAKGI